MERERRDGWRELGAEERRWRMLEIEEARAWRYAGWMGLAWVLAMGVAVGALLLLVWQAVELGPLQREWLGTLAFVAGVVAVIFFAGSACAALKLVLLMIRRRMIAGSGRERR